MSHNAYRVISPASHYPITGTLSVPGDKSITHRALFFGSLNKGRTIIVNPSSALDCRSTLELLKAIGHEVSELSDRVLLQGYRQNGHRHSMPLDCGNSGTTARLATGLLTGERGVFTLNGDPSLRRRPMERVAEPLRKLGADVQTTDGAFPVIVTGSGGVAGNLEELIPVSSAQVHAALVLAALRSETGVAMRRTKRMRDHTLRILHKFGAEITSRNNVDVITPLFLQRDTLIEIPGDVSSAAFPIAAAILVPGSELRITNVGLNPTRIGFLQVLQEMGAEVRWDVLHDEYEPIGEITARYSPNLHAVSPDPDAVAGMLDELPLFAFIASQAEGTSTVAEASELRLKESDRITACAEMLRTLGIVMEEHPDGFTITGKQAVAGGTVIEHHGDHRLCMTAAVTGLIAAEPVQIPDPDIVSISYPGFWDLPFLSLF